MRIEELHTLRDQIIKAIADNPEALVLSDTTDYATVLELARITGRTDLLKVAFDKANQLTDSEQSQAWIEVLNAVETEISLASDDDTTENDTAQDNNDQQAEYEQPQE